MSDRDPGRTGGDHAVTEGVFLYVRGEMDEHDRTALERHADVCPVCRARVDTVRWLHDQIQERGDALFQDHVPVETMVRFAEAPASLTATERADVDDHLAICESCETDLELLSSVTATIASEELVEDRTRDAPKETPVVSIARPRPAWWQRRIWAYAAVLALAIPTAIGIRSLVYTGDGPGETGVPAPPVMLKTQEDRGLGGGTQTVSLPEKGTLALSVEIPMSTDPGLQYHASLRSGGNTVWEEQDIKSIDTFGTFVFRIPVTSLEPGFYELVIAEQRGDAAEEEFIFPFDLVGGF